MSIRMSCNLCNMLLPMDIDVNGRKAQHERWHTYCKKEGRNTTEGIVIWSVKNE